MIRSLLLISLVLSAFNTARAEDAFDPDAKLRALGLELPVKGKPIANYVPSVRTGNLVYLAGHGPCGDLQPKQKGAVGKDRTIDEGYQTSRDTALCLISSLKSEIGDLRKVRRIVKVFGLVNAVDGFENHPKVINGASDLLVAVFGDRGRHARSAVGVSSLPMNLSVEIEMVVEVAD